MKEGAMRRPLVVLVCLALAAGVAFGATRLIPSSSKACGGYHLAIDNGSGSEVAIVINGQPVRNLPADQSADISEWGNWHAGAMPWDVEVTRITDGVVLLTAHLTNDGSDGRRVRIEPAPQSQTNMAGYTCGEV
jgi:hypothetical protein